MRARALRCVPRPDAAPAVLREDVVMLFVTSHIASRSIGPGGDACVRLGTPTSGSRGCGGGGR